MKSLSEYVKESLLDVDDFDLDAAAEQAIKQQILDFIKTNYFDLGQFKISDNKNRDGKYVVYSNSPIIVRNNKITHLTNGKFVWGNTKKSFICAACKSLKTLEGAPNRVGEDFNCNDCLSLISLKYSSTPGQNFFCNNCSSLKTLEGAPKTIGYSFDCCYCESLTSLKGAPEKVRGSFDCRCCESLKTLEGAPKEVGEDFVCKECESLTSLKGAPKKVGHDFNCVGCKESFTEDDVKEVSQVHHEIYC